MRLFVLACFLSLLPVVTPWSVRLPHVVSQEDDWELRAQTDATDAADGTLTETTTALQVTTTLAATTTETVPSIASVLPGQGAQGYRATITITGTNFGGTNQTAGLGTQDCVNQTWTATTVKCTTNQTNGTALNVWVTIDGVTATYSTSFTWYETSPPVSTTVAGDINTWGDADDTSFKGTMQALLRLATIDQVFINGRFAGSVRLEYFLTSSADQPNGATDAVTELKAAAADGRLAAALPGATVVVDGVEVEVAVAANDDDDDLKGWEIALIVIGAFLGVALIAAIVFFVVKWKKSAPPGSPPGAPPGSPPGAPPAPQGLSREKSAPFVRALEQYSNLYHTNDHALI